MIKKIAEYVGCEKENIQYFGGSDAALEYIARTFISPGDLVGIVSPTYDNFRVYAESCGGRIFFIYNKNPFEKDINRLYSQINKNKFRLIYLVNPNNPTGVLYFSEEIEILLKKFPQTLFVIDEAYYEFCGISCSNLIKNYGNIIITRSFTKAFGLGSFRLGYVIAPKYIIEYLNKIRVGKNINMFAQIAGIVALDNKQYMEKYVEEVKKAKELTVTEMERLGFEVVSTPANFILIKVDSPSEFIKKLEDNNIFVRDRSSEPQLEGYVRITIGDMKTMEKFLEKIKKITK